MKTNVRKRKPATPNQGYTLITSGRKLSGGLYAEGWLALFEFDGLRFGLQDHFGGFTIVRGVEENPEDRAYYDHRGRDFLTFEIEEFPGNCGIAVVHNFDFMGNKPEKGKEENYYRMISDAFLLAATTEATCSCIMATDIVGRPVEKALRARFWNTMEFKNKNTRNKITVFTLKV